MAKVLSREANKKLKEDALLFALVAIAMDIPTQSLVTLVKRNSKSLNNWETVELIAKALNKNPMAILTKEQ